MKDKYKINKDLYELESCRYIDLEEHGNEHEVVVVALNLVYRWCVFLSGELHPATCVSHL